MPYMHLSQKFNQKGFINIYLQPNKINNPSNSIYHL